MFHLRGICICLAADLDAPSLACLRRLLKHDDDEEDGVLADHDGADDDLVDGAGDVYLCESELRGILDKQKNHH